MFRLFACILALVTLVYPSLAQSQYLPKGYAWQCDNGACRLVPIQQQRPVQIIVRDVPMATPVSYRTFAVQPVQAVQSVPIQFASYSTSAPTVTALDNCGCAANGVCTCPPGNCNCLGCTCQAQNMSAITASMAATPVTYSSSYAAYPVSTAYYGSGASVLTYTAAGSEVAVTYDAFGNAYVSHSGGRDARRAARWKSKGIRHGWTN